MIRKAVVCGGRDYHPTKTDALWLRWTLQRMRIAEVIHGDCKHRCNDKACDRDSVDQWSGRVGKRLSLIVRPCPADWSLGERAGPLRNKAMVELDGVVCTVAFPGGSGTNGTIDITRSLSLPVFQRWHGPSGFWVDESKGLTEVECSNVRSVTWHLYGLRKAIGWPYQVDPSEDGCRNAASYIRKRQPDGSADDIITSHVWLHAMAKGPVATGSHATLLHIFSPNRSTDRCQYLTRWINAGRPSPLKECVDSFVPKTNNVKL